MTTSDKNTAVAGLRIFVAEDEFPVLQLIEDMLEELGCYVADAATSVPTALELALSTDADIAILDLNLRGESAFPVAQILRDRGIPILFSTGYGAAGLAPTWQDCPVIQKPFPLHQLACAIARTTAKE